MKKIPFILYLVSGFIITAAAFYGYSLNRHRAGLPLEIRPYVEKSLLVQIDDIQVITDQDVEFIFCRRSVGDWASFYVKTDTGIEKKQARLVKHYLHVPYPMIYLAIGLFLIILAFVVFLLRPQEIRARIFYWASLSFSCAMIVNQGFYCLREGWFPIFRESCFMCFTLLFQRLFSIFL